MKVSHNQFITPTQQKLFFILTVFNFIFLQTHFLYFKTGSNSSFEAPQIGQVQSSGKFSKGVPGGMLFSGSPSSGS